MELVKVNREEFGLSEEQALVVANRFMPVISEMEKLVEEYEIIKDLPVDDPKNSKTFDDLRKKFMKTRTSAAAIHKSEKAYFLAGGRYVDSWKNKQLEVVEKYESDLTEKSEYFKIKEAKRKKELADLRLAELLLFDVDGSNMNLGDMPDDLYSTVLEGAKSKFERLKQEAIIAEQQRLLEFEENVWGQYYQYLSDKEEKEFLRLENERIAKELAEQEAIHLAEKAKADAILKQQQEKAESEMLEQKRLSDIEAEKQAKIITEAKAEQDRLNVEILKKEKEAEAIRLSNEKAEQERKDKEAKELADKLEAEKQALLAPDKDKLIAYVKLLRAIPVPKLETEENVLKFAKFGQTMKTAIKFIEE